ncbi:hypothetical protein REPUB_Repub08aG0139500 [Reevesia pubescens]
MDVNILSYSKYHIDAEVNSGDLNSLVRVIGFYGQPDVCKRKESWILLKTFASRSKLPWCYLGNYNEILTDKEKNGGGGSSSVMPNGKLQKNNI